MKKQTTELIEVLRQMLSKNSDYYSTEEVTNLELAIEALQRLSQYESDVVNSRSAGKQPDWVELTEVTLCIIRFMLEPSVSNWFKDFFN
ncbi:MAG: hypothetical protein JST70_08465 [Bacteroidetes bacterium]|nr:hypothetical protein [Bacteroidota bacterium]